MAETIEETVLRLRGERLTQVAIAERLVLRQSLISEILREAGVCGKMDSDPTGARLNRILTLLAHGYTQARIANEVGVSQDMVSKILRQAGYRHVGFVPRGKRKAA
ncbi:hypothetical protein [Methylobacterium sp. E-045]|uniref:hypothetical protein n=1 Tax=Methylobacterium sp. E-045 TaxID=2836575 RepID=UPI001FBBD1DE|nr:hypothetical protein [Methylobacterium sp. E-045]MCJ2128739.1 hypothetical protein [Methylobacterium sp. E-045]